MTRNEFFQENGMIKVYETRTVDSFKKALKKIEKDNLPHYEGIKFDSVFNQLEKFHICNPGLAPCFGHDLFEEIVAYDLQLYVPYSKDDMADKACKISKTKTKLFQFLRFFPLYVETKIKDRNDLVWILVLLLTEITEVLGAPAIHKSCLPYLQQTIYEYLWMRLTQFPGIKMRPKHHYVWHYPDLILKFEPLMRVWVMRFESKHTYFKRAIRFLHNFINITKSLSEKHELIQSLLRLGADIRSEVQTHNSFLFEKHLHAEDLQAAVLIANLPKNLEECSLVTVKGTVYEKGNAVVVNHRVINLRSSLVKFVPSFTKITQTFMFS